MKRFTDKTALITGGASGIGKATAERLAEEGANIIIADINAAGMRSVADAIRSKYAVSVSTVEFDATNAASCREMVDEAASSQGKLDVLCNIAGITEWGHFTEFADDSWRRVIDTDLNSLFYISKQAMPHLLKTRGNIVNMGSVAGLMGIAYTTAYCAAKAGVIALTKSMAVEFASAGVRVNVICPTGVRTPMHTNNVASFPKNLDMKLIDRLSPKLDMDVCEPEDIAAAVAYLASVEARFITGIALPIDGGQTAG